MVVGQSGDLVGVNQVVIVSSVTSSSKIVLVHIVCNTECMKHKHNKCICIHSDILLLPSLTQLTHLTHRTKYQWQCQCQCHGWRDSCCNRYFGGCSTDHWSSYSHYCQVSQTFTVVACVNQCTNYKIDIDIHCTELVDLEITPFLLVERESSINLQKLTP